jgi:hypothetical protein
MAGVDARASIHDASAVPFEPRLLCGLGRRAGATRITADLIGERAPELPLEGLTLR